MVDNISEEELLLRKRARRRLVGAIALVIAAIIILPMIFDEEPEVLQHEIAIRLPSEAPMSEPVSSLQDHDELSADDQFEEIVGDEEIVENEEMVGASEPFAFESMAPSQLDADPVENQGQQNGVPVPAIKPEKNIAAISAEPIHKDRTPVSSIKEFVVQLGAFSDHSKARHQQQNLVSHGINAYTETLMTTNNKEMMRVRIGPFSTRSAAEQEVIKLRKLGLDGVVTAK